MHRIRTSLLTPRARNSCPCCWHSTATVGLKGKPARRLVSTLDPSKLTIANYIDLQGYSCPRVAFGGWSPQVHYGKTGFVQIKFPPHARGYLYFDRPEPCLHVASGALKFRVAEKDPDVRAAFDAGYDLRMPDGWEPWGTLRQGLTYKPVYDLLRKEGLVTDAQDLRIAQLLRNAPPMEKYRGVKLKLQNRTTVTTVLEPFPMEFSTNMLRLILLDPDEIRFLSPRHVVVAENHGRSPFSGVGLVRFEAARTPWHRLSIYPTQPVLVLRFLEWLEPPTSSLPPETPAQVPGALVMQLRGPNGALPWAANPRLLPEKSWAMLKARDLPSLQDH